MRVLIAGLLLVVAGPQVILHRTPPVIVTLSTSSGAVGSTLTLTGLAFGVTRDDGTVTINGVAATVTSWSDTAVVVTVPTTTTGAVTVLRGGLTSNSLTFTVSSSPACGVGVTCLYVAQSGAGTQDASSCANAKAVTFFNTSGNWDASQPPASGKMGPDVEVFLCGTITTNLDVKGSGSVGHVITIDGSNATLNSKFTVTAKSYLRLQFLSWVDGYTGNEPLVFTSATNVILDHASITNHTPTGTDGDVVFFAHGSPPNDTITVQYGVFSNAAATLGVQSDIISCEGGTQNITLIGNKITQQASDNTQHDDGFQTFCGNGCPGTGGWTNPQNVTLAYNEIVMNSSAANNKSWCMWEPVLGTSYIYGNVFIGVTGGSSGNGCDIDDGGTGNTGYVVNFFNNTLISFTGATNNMLHFDNGGTYNLTNNIIWAQSSQTEFTGSATLTRAFNHWSGGTRPTCTGFPTDTCNATSPSFTSTSVPYDFSLQVTSPDYETGTNAGSPYDTGIAPAASWPNPSLSTRGSTWDKGAYVNP